MGGPTDGGGARGVKGTRLPYGILAFGFGLAAGLLLAFSGLGFLQDSAGAILTFFLILVALTGAVGAVLFLFRKPILRRLFGLAEVQVEQFADPLARVAASAIARDPSGATQAARDLVQIVLARYAWLATRRWVIASLTALVAAMAALAGTALLFKQNQLLASQNALLTDQNAKISAQTDLMAAQNRLTEAQAALTAQDVQLAEAARNAQLAVVVTEIAADLGAVTDAAAEKNRAAGGAGGDRVLQLTNLIDPATDLTGAMVMRIVSASQAMRPYRFLDSGLRPGDDNDKSREAMLRRRPHLPETYARMAAAFGWAEPGPETALVDRPASPERGQLLGMLTAAGLHSFEMLNHFGLDLSFAYSPDATLVLVTFQGGRMSYVDFSGASIAGCDFGGSYLENARFRGARIANTTFAAVTAERAVAPFPKDGGYPAFLGGADFDGAALLGADFTESSLTAATFRRAALLAPVFRGTTLAAASFAGAVLIAPDFAGADLRSTEFDGAILFGEDVLARIAAAAAPGTFKPGNFSVEPATMADVWKVAAAYSQLEEEDITDATGGAAPVRLRRVAGAESGSVGDVVDP